MRHESPNFYWEYNWNIPHYLMNIKSRSMWLMNVEITQYSICQIYVIYFSEICKELFYQREESNHC